MSTPRHASWGRVRCVVADWYELPENAHWRTLSFSTGGAQCYRPGGKDAFLRLQQYVWDTLSQEERVTAFGLNCPFGCKNFKTKISMNAIKARGTVSVKRRNTVLGQVSSVVVGERRKENQRRQENTPKYKKKKQAYRRKKQLRNLGEYRIVAVSDFLTPQHIQQKSEQTKDSRR